MTDNTDRGEKFKWSRDLGLEYLDRHLGTRYIFPIKAGKKFPPLIKNNLEDASNDPVQITAWAKLWPGCNWGVALRKSKLMVADVDVSASKGKVGQETYDGLDLAYGWPDTEIVTTPSGGHHHYYEGWADADHPEHIMALGANGIGKDIDVPNYVLISGCVFDDGTSYVGNDAEAVKCPAWIYDVIKSSKTKSRITNAGEIVVELDQKANVATAIDFLKNDAVPSIAGDGGDYNLLKAAYYLKDLGISQGLGAELLNEHFNPRCEPAWDLDDLAKKMAGAYSYANLSKVGGKTAQADFDGEPVPVIKPQGIFNIKTGKVDPPNLKKLKAEKRDRVKARTEEQTEADDKKARPIFDAVLKELILCTSPVAFVARDDTQLINVKTFNAANNPFTARMSIDTRYKDDAAKYVISLPFGRIDRVKGLCYRPGDETKIVEGQANMWRKPPIEPLDGPPTILLDHIEYLIPNEAERELLLNWLAHCVQKPMIKLMFAMLVVDEKGGTGKSWFGYLLRVILGEANVLLIGKDDKVDAKFNAKFFNKCFTFIHEAMPGGKSNLVEALKDKITEDTIWIEPKGVDEFKAENRNNIMAVTNHAHALKIMQSDRRWAVVMGTTDIRYCDDLGNPTPKSVAYYDRLFKCIGTPSAPGDEARRVLNYFMTRDLSKFNGQSAAPMTEAKGYVADATQGNWTAYLNGAKVGKRPPFTHELFTASDVLDVLGTKFTTAANADVRTPALREALIECGCRKLDKQVWIGKDKVRLWTLSPGMAERYRKMTGPAVSKLYRAMRAGEIAEPPDDETPAEVLAEALKEFDEVTVIAADKISDEFADLM